MRALSLLVVVLSLLTLSVEGAQKCSQYLIVGCPPGGGQCRGICRFRVCATWDTIPGSANIRNLVISFEGSTHWDPLVGTPEELERAVSGCAWNFNEGEGSIEYTDANGNKHEMDLDDFRAAMQATQQGMDAADRAEAARILAKGRCTNWTAAELRWMIQHVAPASVKGWEIEIECQESEPGPLGISVRRVRTPANQELQGFKLKFKIAVTCSCGGNGNTSELEVDISGP